MLGLLGMLEYWRSDRWVVPKRRKGNTIEGCIKIHKGADYYAITSTNNSVYRTLLLYHEFGETNLKFDYTEYLKFCGKFLISTDWHVVSYNNYQWRMEYSLPFSQQQRTVRSLHNALPNLALHSTQLSWSISTAVLTFLLWGLIQN